MQAVWQLAHILPLLELTQAHRTYVLPFAGLAGHFTVLVRRDKLYERVIYAARRSFYVGWKQLVAREAERIAAIAPPHEDAMVDQEHDGRREDADDGEAEGRDTDSSIKSSHYHKREKERHR